MECYHIILCSSIQYFDFDPKLATANRQNANSIDDPSIIKKTMGQMCLYQ